MITSWPRTIAPIVAPLGSLISSTRRPTTLPLREPWSIAPIASAAPRRSEWTRTTSPRRTCASSEPIVTDCGEIATSIEPLCIISA